MLTRVLQRLEHRGDSGDAHLTDDEQLYVHPTVGDRSQGVDMIYLLAFGAMHSHVVARTRPIAPEVDHLVRFTIGGLRAT